MKRYIHFWSFRILWAILHDTSRFVTAETLWTSFEMVYLSVQRDCVYALEPCDCLKQSQFSSKSAVFLKSVPAYAVINLRREHITIHACISPQCWTHLRIPSLILMPALCASLPELFVSKASLSSSGSSTRTHAVCSSDRPLYTHTTQHSVYQGL